MQFDMAVVGDINIDVVPEPLEKDLEMKEDGQIFVDKLVHRRGGQAANFAVKTSELGSETVFQGKVGDDRHADFLEQHLKDKGVKPRLARSKDVDTGTTTVIPRENGERFYITYADNNSKLEYGDLHRETLYNSRHLARRGVWFSTPMLNEGNKKLLKEAKKQGVETSIDLHWDPYWDENRSSGNRRKKFMETLEHVDFLMGNSEELKMLTEKKELDKAVEKLQRFGEFKTIAHCGPEGSKIYRGNESINIPVEDIQNPENPTGTGDVYDAAFINAWQKGKSLEEAGQKATEEAVKHLKGLN
ncbi:MAG: carbohydrate kinase family protein [Candidatus Nanohalobium sp.]